VVSQDGVALRPETVRKMGPDQAVSATLAPWRKPRAVHDPGKIHVDLALAGGVGVNCLTRSTRNGRRGSGRRPGRSGGTAASPSPRPLADLSTQQPHPPLPQPPQPGRAPAHPLPRTPPSTAALLLEQSVDLVVIKELLGHAHIGVYAHARLRLQRQAIDTLGTALDQADDGPDDPPTAAVVR
jgi:hypothetical protein